MDFRNIFNQTSTDQAEPETAKAPFGKDQEIKRLKMCLLDLNSHSGETKAKTLKALDAGEPIEKIFIELCEGVSLMTGEPLFLQAVKNKLKAYKTA